MSAWSVVSLLVLVCTLQATPTWARPDFGLEGPVENSADVLLIGIQLELTFRGLEANLDFVIGDPDGAREQIRTRLRTIATSVAGFGVAAANALQFATASTSDVQATFAGVLEPLTMLQTFQVVQLPTLLLEIDELAGSPSLVLSLLDVFNMIYASTRNVIGALIQVLSSVQTSSSAAEVSGAVVLRLQRAVRLLRSDVVLLGHIIRSTADGVAVADGFLLELAEMLDNAQDEDQTTLELVLSKLGRFTVDLTNTTDSLRCGYDSLPHDAEEILDNLDDLPGECVLRKAVESLLHSLTCGLNETVTEIGAHYQQLGSNCSGSLLEDLSSGYEEVFELGEELAQIVVGNRPNALFCYNKFSRLIENLIHRLSDGGGFCLKQELSRLRSLQESVRHALPTIVYDVEDLLHNLELCDKVVGHRVTCVAELGELYKHLAKQTKKKLKLIEEFAETETNASCKRQRLCALNSRTSVLHLMLPQLRNAIENCRDQDTHGSHVCPPH